MGINAVWGPPQSGKTTMAIDLAFALSRGGQSVLLISPELYSELAARLNIRIEPEKSLVAAYKNKESLKQIVHTVDDSAEGYTVLECYVYQLPEGIKAKEEELKTVCHKKESAILAQEFERAATLRDKEQTLKKEIEEEEYKEDMNTNLDDIELPVRPVEDEEE